MEIVRMRVDLTVEKHEILPWDYQHKVAGFIYRAMEKISPETAYRLHRKVKYKPFVFSWLWGKAEAQKEGLHLSPGRYRMYLSSPDPEAFSSLLSVFLTSDYVELGKVRLNVSRVRVIEDPEFNGHPIALRTLSPILVRTYKEGKKNPHWDLSPRDPQFFTNLRNNLIKRYRAYYGREPMGKSLRVLEIRNPMEKRIQIRNTYHRAWLMEFTVLGSPDLIWFGYQAGFGEKTGMGFGMVGV